MIDWIVRSALVATVALGQILAPQTMPAPNPDQSPSRIKVEAPLGPGAVYSTGNITTALLDNATTDSTLLVGAAGTVVDISVRVRINHPRLIDLNIQLIAPDGTTVTLAKNVGNVTADFGASNANCSGSLTTFDDDGTTSVLTGAGPFVGAYRPEARLSALYGRRSIGTWTLRISDENVSEAGTLYCWQLVMRRTAIAGDVFGDSRSDLVYWRPGSNTVARHINTTDGLIFLTTLPATDIFAAGDFDGNAVVDPVWFTPSTGTWEGYGGLSPGIIWGGAGDVPVPGDYDASGNDDIAVWRPSTGTWYVRNQFSWAWGGAGDIPVPADYNGDGTTDMAVWRPSTGAWYVYGGTSVTWGGAGDIPVPADYDADGRTDFGIWRPATGEWFILTATGSVLPIHTWGGNGDIPVPADYDGDLKAEVAVWRPSDGTYHIRNVGSVQHGQAGDVPIQKRPAYPGYPY